MNAADFAAANLSRATGAGLDPHEYLRVTGELTDLEQWGEAFMRARNVGLVGLSLGGYYVAESAARESRVAAAVTVSGPIRLHYDVLPLPVRELLSRRAGGEEAARRFAGQVDLSALAPRIACPLLVVDGGQDVIPGVTNGEPLARLAPHGRYLSLPHGDHLLGNARPDWLVMTADWIAGALA